MNPALPPAPPPPQRPFTFEEIQKRLRPLLDHDEFPDYVLDAMDDEGCTLMDDLKEVTVELLEDESFDFFVALIPQAWRMFVPEGTAGNNVSRAALRKAIERELRNLSDALSQKGAKGGVDYFSSGAQPILTGFLFEQLGKLVDDLPKNKRPPAHDMATMGMVLRAVVDELDHAQRQPG